MTRINKLLSEMNAKSSTYLLQSLGFSKKKEWVFLQLLYVFTDHNLFLSIKQYDTFNLYDTNLFKNDFFNFNEYLCPIILLCK